MKMVIAALLGAFLLFLGIQVWRFSAATAAAENDAAAVREALLRARADHAALVSDYGFYLNPANLEKELRARFNYRREDEQMIILVPRPATSTQ
jgi:hypothetical protein